MKKGMANYRFSIQPYGWNTRTIVLDCNPDTTLGQNMRIMHTLIHKTNILSIALVRMVQQENGPDFEVIKVLEKKRERKEVVVRT